MGKDSSQFHEKILSTPSPLVVLSKTPALQSKSLKNFYNFSKIYHALSPSTHLRVTRYESYGGAGRGPLSTRMSEVSGREVLFTETIQIWQKI
jgi:hypothetical protein